ncbi:hypothetical protein D516_1545 [Rhodobacter sp. AKP1]|nr:hypothetical protein D516_1545 [Rhodobacter sp. AKP1]
MVYGCSDAQCKGAPFRAAALDVGARGAARFCAVRARRHQ